MKRRTRLIAIGCVTIGGTFSTAIAAQAAYAAPATGAILPKVTVHSGDSLSTIGARTHRTWQQLAAFNRIPDPNLIYAGQVLSIPPPTYLPASAPALTASTRPVTEVSATTGSPATTVRQTPAPVAAAPSAAAPSGIWACIAAHESGGVASTNTGNGYYGMYQDTQSSWIAGGGLAYAPRADEASAAAQTAVNQRIQAQQGWGAWPVTSGMCGA